MTIQGYLKAIRNPAKRTYAYAYLAWVLSGRPERKEPEYETLKLSYMAAQAVRHNINALYPQKDDDDYMRWGKDYEIQGKEW